MEHKTLFNYDYPKDHAKTPLVNIGFHPNHASQSQDNQQSKTYLNKTQAFQIL